MKNKWLLNAGMPLGFNPRKPFLRRCEFENFFARDKKKNWQHKFSESSSIFIKSEKIFAIPLDFVGSREKRGEEKFSVDSIPDHCLWKTVILRLDDFVLSCNLNSICRPIDKKAPRHLYKDQCLEDLWEGKISIILFNKVSHFKDTNCTYKQRAYSFRLEH